MGGGCKDERTRLNGDGRRANVFPARAKTKEKTKCSACPAGKERSEHGYARYQRDFETV
jgi:hypothetical protein